MWRVDVDVVGDIKSLRQELPASVSIEVLGDPGPSGHPEVRLLSEFRTVLFAFLVRHGYDLDAHEIVED
jgi:hypothetical protein